MKTYRRARSFTSFLGLASAGLLLSLAACEDGGSADGDDTDGTPTADAAVSLPPDAAPPPDAPPPPPVFDAAPPNTTCADDPPFDGDAGVPETIALTGSVATVSGMSLVPLEGASVVPRYRADDSPAGEAGASDSQGEYGVTATSNGVPFDGYLSLALEGYVSAYIFPPDPVVADLAAPQVIMFQPGILDLIAGFLMADIDAGEGMMFVNLVDCVGAAPNETVLTLEGGDMGTQIVDASMFGQAGLALIVNIPIDKDPETMEPLPTTVTLKAKYNDFEFQPNHVKVFADSITFTQIHP